jgi:trigger factor
MTQAFQIKETENNGLKRAYTVVVSFDYIEGKLGEELKRVGEKVKIPGFRPGKVPMQVLKQRYKANAIGDVLNSTVDDVLRTLIAEHKAVPALRPDVKIESYEDDADMSLSVNFEIMPESPEIDYSVVNIEKPAFSVSEDEVNKSLTRLADGKREMKDVETSSATGNVVVIDFKGFLGDEPFAGGEGKGYSLELGSGQFIPGFEEQLVGKKAGDACEVNVTFPADYHSKDLAGKETRFEVMVHKVQEVNPAVIDNTLATAYGYESLDVLKGFIREQLEKEHTAMSRGYLKKQLFDALEKQCGFDVPEAMLKLEFDSIWKQAVQEAKAEGKSEADVELEREQYSAIARRRVQLGILLSQTAGRNQLEVTQKDMQAAIFEQAKMYPGQEMKILEFFQKNPQQAQELRGPILEEKAVDFILERITVNESSKTLDELLEAEDAATSDVSASANAKKAAEKAGDSEKKAASSEKKTDADASEKKTAKQKKED